MLKPLWRHAQSSIFWMLVWKSCKVLDQKTKSNTRLQYWTWGQSSWNSLGRDIQVSSEFCRQSMGCSAARLALLAACSRKCGNGIIEEDSVINEGSRWVGPFGWLGAIGGLMTTSNYGGRGSLIPKKVYLKQNTIKLVAQGRALAKNAPWKQWLILLAVSFRIPNWR